MFYLKFELRLSHFLLVFFPRYHRIIHQNGQQWGFWGQFLCSSLETIPLCVQYKHVQLYMWILHKASSRFPAGGKPRKLLTVPHISIMYYLLSPAYVLVAQRAWNKHLMGISLQPASLVFEINWWIFKKSPFCNLVLLHVFVCQEIHHCLWPPNNTFFF